MPAWLWIPIIVLALVSRPLEVRLWRAGHLSDRALTLLVLARFPVLTAVAVFASGPTPLGLAIIAVSLIPGLLFYRYLLTVIREQSGSSN